MAWRQSRDGRDRAHCPVTARYRPNSRSRGDAGTPGHTCRSLVTHGGYTCEAGVVMSILTPLPPPDSSAINSSPPRLTRPHLQSSRYPMSLRKCFHGACLMVQWLRDSACHCRGHGFDPSPRKIPYAVEQLSPHATTTHTQ